MHSLYLRQWGFPRRLQLGCDYKRKSAQVKPCRENGNAVSFLGFIEFLLARNWFNHGDVLIMDNASIHTGQEADIAEDLLWEASQVLVFFLPTRSPELNPTELVFHILSRRIRSHRYRHLSDACDQAVLDLSCQVLDNIMAFGFISQCCRHCGY
jgi:transposase